MTTGSTEKVNGAKAIIKCLEKEGVDTLFGYPGGQIIPFYNELYDSELRHILVRHEQAAAHAADWKDRGLRIYFRSRSNQPCNRYCYRIHGFSANCSLNRPGTEIPYRK